MHIIYYVFKSYRIFHQAGTQRMGGNIKETCWFSNSLQLIKSKDGVYKVSLQT